MYQLETSNVKTLKPKLKSINTAKLKTLEAKAGSTIRERGGSWTAKRQRVALSYGYRCACCKCVWVSSRDEIDHIVPLEQGGSNDDSNCQPLCYECHQAKTKEENQARLGAF